MKIVLGLLLVACSFAGWSTPQVNFDSGKKQVALLELYSSQGCSSCPPAQKWVNRYLDKQSLFNDVIPVVFHVDYWNYLGWADPFSAPEYSARQRAFKLAGLTRSVYTPGFMVNGSEWRGWFHGQPLSTVNQTVGVLKADVDPQRLVASFASEQSYSDEKLLHVALLGMKGSTKVTRGENKRKRLKESFIVLDYNAYSSRDNQWQLDWSKPHSGAVKQYAIALWVTGENALIPIQATGGMLPDTWFNAAP